MERDCILSHGCSALLKGKLMDNSDRFEVHVCGKKGCGLLAMWNEDTGSVYCRPCRSSIGIRKIVLPYATKLLFQELYALCIAPRLILDGDDVVSVEPAEPGTTRNDVLEKIFQEMDLERPVA
jgi:DNA-directed RNA polymerase II subunit RPB2